MEYNHIGAKMLGVDEIIALIVFITLAILMVAELFTGRTPSPFIADIAKTIIGFVFGKKYGAVKNGR